MLFTFNLIVARLASRALISQNLFALIVNKKGHEINTCFKIHGNHDWYEERLRARNAGRLDKGTA